MNIVATFDPAQNTSGTTTAITTGKVVCYNESNINLIFTFGNGHSEYAPAWTAVIFCGPFGSPNFQWNRQATLVTGSGPISQVILVAYEHQEFVPGTFPSPLVRQTNIGNSIPVNTSATSIVNDGNIATTPIIESTVSGGPSSNVSIDNSGNAFLAQTVAGVVTKLFQTVANAAVTVLLGAAGKTVEVLGSLKVDQSVGIHGPPNATIGLTIDPGNDANKALAIFQHSATQSANLVEIQDSTFTPVVLVDKIGHTVIGSTPLPGFLQVKANPANNNDMIFDASTGRLTIQNRILTNLINTITGNDFAVNVETGHHLFFQVNGANQVEIDANGVTLLQSNPLNFATGSISRISKFSGTTANGSVSVAHGLGAIPDWAMAIWNLSSTPAPHTIGCDLSGASSTNITVWADLGGVPFYGLAIKF